MNVDDIIGVGKATEKLFEVVSKGLGVLYKPRAMRNEADAEAYKVVALAKAEAEAGIIKAESLATAEHQYEIIKSGGELDLLSRTKARLFARELESQSNLEEIVEQAIKHLPRDVSKESVSDDWRRKFFIEAENVCDADLQMLWGKVLAGEVTSPGSYSLRTLEVLKHLSKNDAEIFRKACNLAFWKNFMVNYGTDINTTFKPYGFFYADLLLLRDAGLLHHSDTLMKDFTDPTGVRVDAVLENNGILMHVKGEPLKNLQLPGLIFTKSGSELANLIEPNPNLEYLNAVAVYLRTRGMVVKRQTETVHDGVIVSNFDEDF